MEITLCPTVLVRMCSWEPQLFVLRPRTDFCANFYANLVKMCVYSFMIQSNLFVSLLWRQGAQGSYTSVRGFWIVAGAHLEMKHLHSSHTTGRLSVPYCINSCNLRCVRPPVQETHVCVLAEAPLRCEKSTKTRPVIEHSSTQVHIDGTTGA